MLYRLEQVVVSFAGKKVLGPLDFQHNPGERLVLLGRNGCGKTTLLRLIAGELEPETGRVVWARGLRIASVEQMVSAKASVPVLSYVLEAFPEFLALERQRHKLSERLAGGEQVLEELSAVQEQLEHMEADRLIPRVQGVLQGLGIPQELHYRPLGELSGGQRTRVALARALSGPADLLLLDEPSNHLDLLGSEFLAAELQRREGALLLVTHDRALADAVGGDFLELSFGRLERYRGPFGRFLRERAARREQQRHAWEQQQQEIARQQEFIRRNMAGQNTRQAQARAKLLARWELLPKPEEDPPAVKLRWPPVPRSGDRVLEVENLSVGYSCPLVTGVSFALRRGERLAVVGPNGAGKTALLKTLAGFLPPLAGFIRLGSGVVAGYYHQEQQAVAGGTVLEVLAAGRPDWSPAEVRAWAGAFGFAGDRQEEVTAVLSGGEKSRLQLALLLAQAPNLLLLDEPTNHLDWATAQNLLRALQDFPGAALVVSHDRAFLAAVSTGVLVLHRGRAEQLQTLEEAFQLLAAAPAATRDRAPAPRRSPQEAQRRAGEQQRKQRARLRAELETQLAQVEEEQRAIEAQLCTPEVQRDWTQAQALAARREELARRWEELFGLWAAVAEAEGEQLGDQNVSATADKCHFGCQEGQQKQKQTRNK